jgi:hypothetical protein
MRKLLIATGGIEHQYNIVLQEESCITSWESGNYLIDNNGTSK